MLNTFTSEFEQLLFLYTIQDTLLELLKTPWIPQPRTLAHSR